MKPRSLRLRRSWVSCFTNHPPPSRARSVETRSAEHERPSSTKTGTRNHNSPARDRPRTRIPSHLAATVRSIVGTNEATRRQPDREDVALESLGWELTATAISTCQPSSSVVLGVLVTSACVLTRCVRSSVVILERQGHVANVRAPSKLATIIEGLPSARLRAK
jgi:hypothetical protein